MLELVTDTRLDLALSTARFGEGLFETIRIQNGRPRWLNYHLERLSGQAALSRPGRTPRSMLWPISWAGRPPPRRFRAGCCVWWRWTGN